MKAVTKAQRLTSIVSRLLSWALLGILCTSVAAQEKPASPAGTKVRTLVIVNKPWTGDFDALVARRMIRVVVPYSRTLFFTDKGRERGLTAELIRDFERDLNQKHRSQLGKRPITVYMVPTTRDKLLSGVAAGLGDIAAHKFSLQRGHDFGLGRGLGQSTGKAVLLLRSNSLPQIGDFLDP
jgi:hypothetical protein